MGNKLPSWLSPRLDSVPEPLSVARARMGGQGRTKKCTTRTLKRIARQGGTAAMKALTPEQRIAKASKAANAANLVRWGWSAYKLSRVPSMSHRMFQVLAGLEKCPEGNYPVKLWRECISCSAGSEGSANQIFRRLFRAGFIAQSGGKSPYGRPLYVITQSGRDALAGVCALIVGGV